MDSLDRISVITCTADRPKAFELCCGWMDRQTFPRTSIEWIIADDGERPAITPAQAVHVYSRPAASPKESFRQNMLAGLEAATYDKIVILEDDDWYHPSYLSMMSALLDVRELVGGARARYYHVRERRYSIHPNVHHSSLSTTGFRRSLLPIAQKILRESNFTRPENPQQLDGTLWKRSRIANDRKLLLPESPHVVSIKGMPGKSGLGIHHKSQELRGYRHDPDLDVLREWIGEDFRVYAEFGTV